MGIESANESYYSTLSLSEADENFSDTKDDKSLFFGDKT